MIYVLLWWLIMQVLGWLALPTAMRLFRWLPDRGYAFSKAFGLLISSYLLWIGASTGLLRNDTGGILFALLALAGLSAWCYFRQPLGELQHYLRSKKGLIITVEILFALAFVAWAVLRAYASFKIESAGGEKFMEIAFLNAILRSEHFPPQDPWLSGFAISYYYFGYVMMALVTRFSGAPAGIAFDLYDSLLFALTLIGAFGVVYNLVKLSLHKEEQAGSARVVQRESQPLAAGLLGALFVAFLGNLAGLWEALHSWGKLPASFWTWLDIPSLAQAPINGTLYPTHWMWWWRGSRVIQDVNLAGAPIGASPIDEFPYFSFMLGDNHPHVLALPFVLLAIGVALNLLARQLSAAPAQPGEQAGAAKWWNPVGFALDNDWGLFIGAALVIGALGFLNTWDLPIYLALAVLAYAVGRASHLGRLDKDTLLRAGLLLLALGVACFILYFFFYIGFSSQAGGVLPYVWPPTRMPQFLTMFGAFAFVLACFLPAFLAKQKEAGSRLWKQALAWWGRILLICLAFFLFAWLVIALGSAALNENQLVNSALAALLSGMTLKDGFFASLAARLTDPWMLLFTSGLMALALANALHLVWHKAAEPAALASDQEPALPSEHSRWPSTSELFVFLLAFTGLALVLVVEFVYLRDSFAVRMNTIFKFYYQAWVMMGLASAYGVWWLLNHLSGRLGRGLFLIGTGLVLAASLLYPLMATWSRADAFQSVPNLDGSSGIARGHPDDWAAIEWLNANLSGAPVILESPSTGALGEGAYTYRGRISAFTGLPTVLGWSNHEGQWRGSYTEQNLREPDIITIYTTGDPQLMLDLLRKWQVEYLIVGAAETSYIQDLCADGSRGCNLNMALRKFDLMLEPVFTQGQTTIYVVP